MKTAHFICETPDWEIILSACWNPTACGVDVRFNDGRSEHYARDLPERGRQILDNLHRLVDEWQKMQDELHVASNRTN